MGEESPKGRSLKLPDLSPQRVIRVLGRFGWAVRREGKRHTLLEHTEKRNLVTIPRHRRLKRGTLKAILREAEISIPEFLGNI